MDTARITLKNYRVFSDENPLRIDLGPNFTSLVGKNNSGKSSCLKFFYELRPLWEQFRQHPIISNFLKNEPPINVNYIGIEDYSEIFNNTNDRLLQFEIDFFPSSVSAESGGIYLSKFVGTCDRNHATQWELRFYSNKNKSCFIPNTQGNNSTWSENNVLNIPNYGLVDFRYFLDIMNVLANSIYIGSFRNAINEGAGNYYDLSIGSSFISTWKQWKTGSVKDQNQAIINVTNDIEHIFEYKRLEINPSADEKTLTLSVRPETL